MSSAFKIIQRSISTSSVCHGKRNFRKFLLYNKRGTREFKARQAINPDPEIPIDTRGVRSTGVQYEGRHVHIPEMVPELIVPDLKDFKLKPYVSYRSTNVVQSAFTARDLFDAVYAKKITSDFQNDKLDPNGDPLEPNRFEKMTPEDAKDLAGRTGTDIF